MQACRDQRALAGVRAALSALSRLQTVYPERAGLPWLQFQTEWRGVIPREGPSHMFWRGYFWDTQGQQTCTAPYHQCHGMSWGQEGPY